jgi:3-oxoadipate enol-lactonase
VSEPDRFVQAGTVRLHYRLEGNGPLVALIHGVGGRLEAWDAVAAELQGRFRVLRYDQRGHGLSDKPPGPYTVEQMSGDLAALLDALGIARCHVVGVSLGGMVAQSFALEHARRVEGLVLIAAVAGRTPEERERVLARLEVVRREQPGAHFRNSLDRWFTPEFQRNHPDRVEAYGAMNRANDPAGYAAAYHVLAHTDLGDLVGAIRAPTLIVTGEFDSGSNPRMARLMHDRIAGSQLVIIPGQRHGLLTETPDRVAQLVADFLTGNLEAESCKAASS